MHGFRVMLGLCLVGVLLALAGCGGGGVVPRGTNTAPTAAFTITPAVGQIDTTFTLDASGSHDAEDPSSRLQVRWDWGCDGTWDTAYSTVKITLGKPKYPGVIAVRLQVIDSGGLTATVTHTVAVTQADYPVPAFTITPTAGDTESVFAFDATGSTDAVDDPATLQVRWDWTNDGTPDTVYSTLQTATHSFSAPGEYAVRLEVQNSRGHVSKAVHLVTVTAPVYPDAVFNIIPITGDTNTNFTFDASASTDPADSTPALQVIWDWDNDGTWDTDFNTEQSLTHRFTTAGTHTVKMAVKNSHGHIDTVTKDIIVTVPRTPPTATFTYAPLNGFFRQEYTFNASGCTDVVTPAADLQVRWDWENDGTWDTAYSTDKVAYRFYNADGFVTVGLQVKNAAGLTDATTARFYLAPPPTGTVTRIFSTPTYQPRTPVQVSLSLSYGFEQKISASETVPAGWTISNVTYSGTEHPASIFINTVTNTITWTFSQPETTAALIYTATPPQNATGTAVFAGTTTNTAIVNPTHPIYGSIHLPKE